MVLFKILNMINLMFTKVNKLVEILQTSLIQTKHLIKNLFFFNF